MAKMNTMQIKVGESSWLSLDNGDYVDTPIHVKCGDIVFPDEEWTDVTFPMLCEWAEMVTSNTSLNRRKYSLFFHDGPYRLDVEQKDNNNINVRCINFRRRDFCECGWSCLLEELVVAIYTAILDFNNGLLTNNQINPDPGIYKQTKLYEKKLVDFLVKIEDQAHEE